MFEKLKANRKSKKMDKDPYLSEELRLLAKMKKLQPGTDEYAKAQAELKNINIMRSESRESKRRISKADRGGILIKILGIGGGALGLFSIIKAERDGMTFTGEKRSIMDSIARAVGKIFSP